MFPDLSHHSQEGYVCFTSTRWSTNEQVLVTLKSNFMKSRLNSIEGLESFESRLAIFRESVNPNQNFILTHWLRLEGRDVDLLITCKNTKIQIR